MRNSLQSLSSQWSQRKDMAGKASTIADLSTARSFSLLKLAKARVLSSKLDTTGYLNPDFHHHADLEALGNLELTRS